MGCSDEEKFYPQMISFTISINFINYPLGASTDLLQDTVCYSELVKMITLYCKKNRFNLIEYLAKSVHQKIFDSLALYINNLRSITVTLNKISPPVPDIHDGVKWTHHINY